jgi:hypothetical protein
MCGVRALITSFVILSVGRVTICGIIALVISRAAWPSMM